MSDFIEVAIDSVRISLTNQQRIVLLRELNADRYLPIWIGPYEAESITIALQEIEIARPQTHDLLLRAIEQLKGALMHIEIVALKGDVFYGNLAVKANEDVILIDSRPSDSLALAVRAHVPILVSRSVMDIAGITQEQDLQSIGEDETEGPEITEESEEAKKRLSVFEDFLENVNPETPDDHQNGEEDQPSEDDNEK
jgi:bifunctional DNase/RNase